MHYQMQEGYVTLTTGDWRDRTVNMLAATHLPVKGVSLVVTREPLPDGLSLADYLVNQKSVLAKELPKFRLLADSSDNMNGQPAHYLEVAWDNQGVAMQQIVLVIDNNRNIINFTATIPGAVDEQSRTELLTVMRSFKPGPAPAETGETAP
ncbi:MAG: DcrB-related protein [Geobacteraceae bacterium]|nr:DcrB-related protein [Geobacteraceae bacterium]